MLRRFLNIAVTKEPHIGLNSTIRMRFSEGGERTTQLIVEDNVHDALRKSFPKATYIQVEDMSGGCGAMFDVSIEAHEFKGLSIVKQHRLVNDSLKELIKNMHGIKITTSAPPEY